MLDKLEQIVSRYEELTQELSSPELLSNPSAYGKVAKQHRALEEVVKKYQSWKALNTQLSDARELFDTSDDEEMREMARLELETLQTQLEDADRELKLLLIPTDPNDEKNVILEIRAGTGGEEAALFAADLFRMYSRYAEQRRWKVEVLSASESEKGGFKEIRRLTAQDAHKPKGKYTILTTIAEKYTTNPGHPGNTTPVIDEIFNTYLIPQMFAEVAQGKMTPADPGVSPGRATTPPVPWRGVTRLPSCSSPSRFGGATAGAGAGPRPRAGASIRSQSAADTYTRAPKRCWK